MSDPLLQLIEKLPLSKRAVLARMLQPEPDPIAIVGMSCRFPHNCRTPEAFWQLLVNGHEGIVEVPKERWLIDEFYDPDPYKQGKMYTRHGGFMAQATQFDADFFGISSREALRMDPQQRLLLELAWEALENAFVDPKMLAGSLTGVFVGILANQYAERQLQADYTGCINDPYYGIGCSSSVAAGRLSYFFDFQGPSIALDTACSSSLVALHLACESLRQKECDLAVVGGVHMITLPESMVNACKMRMLAADGRCKSFDARADGFALGEGGGIVLVKRLQDALDDGNPILGIVRGTAINEDGRSSSLTAPNGLAQQAVMRQALKQAKLEPHLVGYIEAHGSGTPLGDPIEAESIESVYGNGRCTPLSMGTVKTNIGHLTAGAGIAGLIKTILALHHQTIPPHLNFITPNPNIPWQEMHIQIPTEPAPWEPIEGRRIAGINSFGWSGTNAHVLVEAPPQQERAEKEDTPRPYALFTLSARTEQALDTLTEQFITQIHTQEDISLGDVAYSLQKGRHHFPLRRIFVCANTHKAIHELAVESALSKTAPPPRPVAFLLPGLGDQYEHMTCSLYKTEPLFKEIVDHCCDQLKPYLGLDLRDILYPERPSSVTPPLPNQQTRSFRQMLGRGSVDEIAGKLNQTIYAQPALFVIEYALSQLWLSWGIRPAALIGYSLGEFVAACLSGVYSLADGLKLVATRGKLIQALPTGAMLAVALPEEALTPLLPSDVSISAVNGPNMCVLSGETPAITAFAVQLRAEGHVCRQLQTTHAFHSPMMQAIVPELQQTLSEITFHPPQIPYVSNVTGTWVRPEEVVSPDYWVQHLLQPVRFAQGIETLWKDKPYLLLEVGLNNALGSLAMQHPIRQNQTEPVVLFSLPSAHDERSETAVLLETVGRLWLSGIEVDWTSFYKYQTTQWQSLPNYPWQHETYWVPYHTNNGHQTVQLPPSSIEKNPVARWFYLPTWQKQPLVHKHKNKNPLETWLLFQGDNGIGQLLQRELKQQDQYVIVITKGEKFERLQDDHFTINPGNPYDYLDLCAHLERINQFPQHIIYLWSIQTHGINQPDTTHFFNLLSLTQAVGTQQKEAAVRLHIMASQAHDILGDEPIQPNQAMLLGLYRVIPKEYPYIQCQFIDIDPDNTPAAAQLIDEFTQTAQLKTIVGYRGQTRWQQTFSSVTLPANSPQPLKPHLEVNGTYMITGGFGGLGYALAQDIARHVPCTLILVGRRPLPDRQQWETILTQEAESAEKTRVQQIVTLEKMGATIYPLSLDIADLAQLQAKLVALRQDVPAIDGLFHLAGVPGEGLIQFKTKEKATAVFNPKIQGSYHLLSTLQQELKFAVLYSSSNAIIGGPGEVDYCAANAYLDTLAHYYTKQNLPTYAINWGAWQWDAWQSDLLHSLPHVSEKIKKLRTAYGISFTDGHEALWRILATSIPQWLVLTQDMQTVTEQWDALSTENLLQEVTETQQNKQRFPRPHIRTTYTAPQSETEQKLAEIWAEALAIEKVGVHDQFFELGGNSLIGMMLISKVERTFEQTLSPATLYEGPTVRALAMMLERKTELVSTITKDATRGQSRKNRREQQRQKRQK